MRTLADRPPDKAVALDEFERVAAVGPGVIIAMPFRTVARLCIHFSEIYVPDAFLLAIILTCVAAAIAVCFTDSGAGQVLDAWYLGLWDIMPFAMQMALILCTGVALARSPLIKRVLRRLADLPNGQTAAAILVFLTAAICCWINWGFGLVVGALLSREIAKRIRKVDFSFLVAAAYMGFMVWASGLSSSIALATA